MEFKNNRTSISFRPKRDRDLLEFFEMIEEGDVSRTIRDLMRDGLKWRTLGNNEVRVGAVHSQKKPEKQQPVEVETPKEKAPKVITKKQNTEKPKEPSKAELEAEFSNKF